MQYTEDLIPRHISRVLNRESGLMGVSGQAADMRDVIAMGRMRLWLMKMYVDRIHRSLVVLNGADAIIPQ